LELPATGWLRRYRVRALGRVQQDVLDRLRSGITIDGIRYGPIEATLDREQGANVWLTFGIREGKNREVRKVLETLGLKVNRLIRVAFGPFELGDLDDGAVKEIETAELRTKLGEQIITEAGADFDAPHIVQELKTPPHHSGARAKAREPALQRCGTRSPLDSGRHNQNDRKKRRRDRSGGPRPSRPRPK
jgi:23S rRNA pseudouridine2605 synthase